MSESTTTTTLEGISGSGRLIAGKYRLLEKVASGGMGVVMRARHEVMEREVAVKLMHPHVAKKEDFTARFRREARVATLFNHPNITRVYDFGTTDEGVLYLVMELLEGEELQDLLDRDSPLTLGRTIDIGVEFLDGLAEAHSLEVIHRDLKPSNIFLAQTNRGREIVKILDFGIATLVDDNGSTLTKTGMVAGTASYVAPERLIGDAESYGMDVYAAGLIILEMMTGRRVFDAETVAECLLMQLKTAAPIPEPIANTPLGPVLKCATAKHPDDRYENAEDFLEAFSAAAEDAPRDLRLSPDDLPPNLGDTTSSILKRVAHGDENLDALQRISDDADTSIDELNSDDLVETIVYETNPEDLNSTIVSPSRSSQNPSSGPPRKRPPSSRQDGPPRGFGPPPPKRAVQSDSTLDGDKPKSSADSSREEPTTPDPESVNTDSADGADTAERARQETALIGERGPSWKQTAADLHDTQSSRPKRLYLALGVIALVAVALGLGIYATGNADEEAPPGTGSATQGPERQASKTPENSESESRSAAAGLEPDAGVLEVTVELRSSPVNAEVYEDDELLGQTHFAFTYEQDSPPETLRFEKDGYQTMELDWPEQPGDVLRVELKPEKRRRVIAEPERAPKKQVKPKKSEKRKKSEKPSPRPEKTDPAEETSPDKDVDAVLDRYLPEP